MNEQEQSNDRWMQSLAVAGIFVYAILFLVNPPQWLPVVLQNIVLGVQGLIVRAIRHGVGALGIENAPSELVSAVYFLFIAGLIPVLIAQIARRRLFDLGWRSPNRLALRYFLVALVVSAPFLIWMVNSPTIGRPYLKQLDRLGFVAFSAFYVINMFTEHLFLHGVVLGLARSNGRWPEGVSVPSLGNGFAGVLRWLGLGMPGPHSASRRVSGWLGLMPGCLFPIFFSAMLFGMVHLGKDARELVLAFPGGLAQAYIAYRSNSWWTPFFIHLATASMALTMMVWMA